MQITKYFNKSWKVSLSLILLLLGVIFIMWGYNLSHSAELFIEGDKIINKSEMTQFLGEFIEKCGEFLLLVISLHFLYEMFVKDLDEQQHFRILEEKLEPQQAFIKAIQEDLASLKSQTQLVLNLVSCNETVNFERHWKNMYEKFDKFWFIGDIPFRYLEDISNKPKEGAQVFLYTTISDKNRESISKLLEKFSEESLGGNFNPFHISRFDWGFTIIASNQQENKIEVLLNYNTSSTENPTGYFMFGDTAIALHKSIGKRLAGTSSNFSPENDGGAVPIENIYMLKYLATRRFSYLNELKDAKKGVNLVGDDLICNQMAELLRNCKDSLDVTHIARKDSIDLLEGDPFLNWLDENYRSVKESNITIRRVFLIEKTEFDNPTLRRCIEKQINNGIVVKYCFVEKIPTELEQDFSIYDERFLIYISQKTGGPWREEKGEDKNQAKLSSNKEIISHFREIFNQLIDVSKDFPKNSHETSKN